MKKLNRVVIKCCKLVDNSIIIKFPFNQETLLQVKGLMGRTWNKEGKYWKCIPSLGNMNKLIEYKFEFDEALIMHYKSLTEKRTAPVVMPKLKKELYNYQKKGVEFIERNNGRGLIADEMGLGKTVQAIAWTELHPEQKPVIVVCPASLKLNWASEFKQWTYHSSVQVISGTSIVPLTGSVIIINYDILQQWADRLLAIAPKVLILDECHYIKNSSAMRSKATRKLARKIKNIIALSGTPIINKPIEIYNTVNILDNHLFSNKMAFAQRYCGAKHNGFGWDFSGATNMDELHEILTRNIMIRRLKSDPKIELELPDKIKTYVPIEINNRREYEYAENEFIDWVRERKGQISVIKAMKAEAFVKIEALKKLAVEGKLDYMIKWIKDFLESGEKLVLFCTHTFVVDKLMESFPGISVKIDGSVSNAKRQAAVDLFQRDPITRLFVGNIKAAGVGLTLTAASTVCILELPWSPGELDQAEDRCHRIGQKNTVYVPYLLAEETIEMKLVKLLDKKRKTIQTVLDGGDADNDALLTEIINNYS